MTTTTTDLATLALRGGLAILKDMAAGTLPFACTVPGCGETVRVPRSVATHEHFDSASVRCDGCEAADPCFERCVACGTPLTETSELIDNRCTACFRVAHARRIAEAAA